MAAMKAVFFILFIHLSSVYSQHPHAHGHVHVSSESFDITVVIQVNERNITRKWSLATKDGTPDPNVKAVMQRINNWAHDSSITKPSALTGTGFLGMSIKHYINKHYQHTFKLPKCTEKAMGKDIINLAPDSVLSAKDKEVLTRHIDACNKTV